MNSEEQSNEVAATMTGFEMMLGLLIAIIIIGVMLLWNTKQFL